MIVKIEHENKCESNFKSLKHNKQKQVSLNIMTQLSFSPNSSQQNQILELKENLEII